MKIVPANLNRTVITRVVATWAALSLVAGTVAFYVELERVNRSVFALAISGPKRFLGHIDAVGPEHAGHMETQAKELLKGNFISLRLYGADKKLILEALNPETLDLRRDVPPHIHDLAAGELDHHHMIWGNGRLLMQLLLPVMGKDNVIHGYFEGVYAVSADIMGNIKAEIAMSLALTLGIVLVTTAVLYSVITALNRGMAGLSSDLLKSSIELMEVMGSAIALRDSDTDVHNYRVTAYAISMGEALRLSPPQLRDLIAGAFLHDVGKIGISDTILLKPGPFTPEELALMRRHVSMGVDIVANAGWLRGARDVVEFHHEKYDGSGYLKGLANNAIPLGSRVFAIIDVFDALTSRRPYKKPLPFDEAMAILERGRGTHFDPALLDLFRGIAAEIHGQISACDDSALRRIVRSQVAEHFLLVDGAGRG